MHLLLITTPDQKEYLPRFSSLACFHGHRVSVLTAPVDTISALEAKCKAAKIDAIMCASASTLERILDSLPDFTRANTRKSLTLDDYQGSLLRTRGGYEVVVLNPPEHIMTVPYGAFIFTRFITKLTKPNDWYKETKFSWSIGTPETLEKRYTDFQQSHYIAVDIETPLNNPDLLINCISFTAYFAGDHSSHSLVIPFDSIFNLAWIRKFLSLPASKILQGGGYDAVYLLRFNCPIDNWLFDTLHLFHSWYSELPKRLDFVSAFAIRTIRYWKDDGKSGNLEDYYRYNAMDGWATLNSFLSIVGEFPSWAAANYLEEFPLIFPSIHCEIEGWKVDKEQFAKVEVEKKKIAEQKLASIQRMLKAPNFNPRSPKQMGKLFKVLGCGDLGSTDKVATMKAEFRHPLNARILGDIRDYKKEAKLLSTYIVEAKFRNWRLFYRLNPAGTDTGRLASSESSYWCGFQIQNIPRGDSIKSFLVADKGWVLAEPDFEQSEARCVAYLSGDRTLLNLVESGRDYHSWNVEAFFGIPYAEVWDEERKKPKTPEMNIIRDTSKRTNHGANYNMGAAKLLDTMGPKAVAKAKLLLKLPAKLSLKDVCAYLLRQYEKTYPVVKGEFYNSILTEIETTHKLVSPLGHTRWFFGTPRSNKHHLNAAVAHKPQNLSVSIMNRGFYKVWREQVYGKFAKVLRIKAQIHDSLPFQYKQGEDWVLEEISEMLKLPVEVTGSDGKKRTMVIPVGMSAGKHRWSELK